MLSRLASLGTLFALSAACGGAPAPSAPPLLATTVAASSTAATPPPAVARAPLGELSFAVSGSPECQRLFRDGFIALHSFLYDEAHEGFVAALAADPSCAMAAWGDAMTFDHPVWHQRDLPKGRAALAKVTREETLTATERAFIGAARALFASDDGKVAHEAWLAATTKVHAETGDDEAALQHALALLAVYGYDPKHVREQMEAGAIALAVLQRRPEHPGAAHYAIHAFDSREHAILALPAARTYARLAPSAGHAQHMPSHTFVHLGMWREVVPSNEKAYAASVAWEKSHGQSASKHDSHSYSWLVAAHLELGQHTRAKQLLDDARAMVAAATDDSGDLRFDYSNMVADYVLQTGRWTEVEALVAPLFAAMPDEGHEAGGPVACASHAPGGTGTTRMPTALFARLAAHMLRAEAAIRSGDASAADKRVADMRAVRASMGPWAKMQSPSFARRWEATDEAFLARAHLGAKPTTDATKKMLDAVDQWVRADDERPISGPAWFEPPRETYANALLAAGRTKDALATFERALDQRPCRALALLGAARAAKAAGDLALSRTRYASLVELWRDADATIPALAEARDGAK